MTRSLLGFAALFLALASAAPARAADVSELRGVLGFTIGEYGAFQPTPAMTSLELGGRCVCPDFCRMELPGAHVSVRWTRRLGACGADLMTMEGDLAALNPALLAPGVGPVLAMSRAGIEARYGRPTTTSEIGGEQMAYCRLSGDVPESELDALSLEILVYAFRFEQGRLAALRVTTSPVCPTAVFVPAAN